MPQMQMYSAYQAVSPPVPQSSGHVGSSHVPVVTSHQVNVRNIRKTLIFNDQKIFRVKFISSMGKFLTN
jgi:hypothetical protein